MLSLGKAVCGKQTHFGDRAVQIGTNSVEANLVISIKIANVYNLDPTIPLLGIILYVGLCKSMVFTIALVVIA